MRRLPWLLLVLLAGCGGSGQPQVATLAGGSGAPAPTASASKDPERAMLDFARCMRENGVNMPDPGADGRMSVLLEKGEDPAKHEAARKACEKHLEGAVRQIDPEKRQEMQDQFLAFARCMRENGVDMPDPDFSGQGGGFAVKLGGPGSGIDPESPEFKAAEEKCRKHVPDMKGGPGVQDARK